MQSKDLLLFSLVSLYVYIANIAKYSQ